MIEMLLVLSLLTFCLLLFPLFKQNSQTMKLRMEMLREQLLIVQRKAMHDAQNIQVYFDGETMVYEDKAIDLGMDCTGQVLFHANGNVDHAKTITCSSDQATGALVIQLGSGRMYVKK